MSDDTAKTEAPCRAYCYAGDGTKYNCARRGEHLSHWTGIPGFFVSQWYVPQGATPTQGGDEPHAE